MTAGRGSAVRYFDDLAASYADRYGPGGGLWHRHFFEGRRDVALGWLREVEAGGVVLDVGAGPGPLTAPLAARGVRVVTLDRAPAMAREARRAGGLAVVADALALPVSAATCDAAVALGLTSYVSDLPALLRALARTVRPGGLVVVSVAVGSAPDWHARRLLRGPATRLGLRGVLTSGVTLRTRRRAEWRAATAAAGLALEAERAHDFTLFPLSRLLPGPSVVLSRALEALDAPRLVGLAGEVVLRLRVPGPLPPPVRGRRPRVLRIIARLNVGGPALHTVLLSQGLAPTCDTTLAVGSVGPGEVEAVGLLRRRGVRPLRIPGLGRAPSPVDDARAFAALLVLMRRTRPDIVHTHTAKAGALGRVAAWLCGVPHVVHTFHGHVFHGYFGPLLSRFAVLTERVLARRTDRVVAVSREVEYDLVERYRIADRPRVRVVPVGLPLARLAALGADDRAHARAALGIASDAPVVSFVGRLVPVKEPAVALAVWARVRRAAPSAVLLVVGGGPLLGGLRSAAPEGVRFLGWCDDVAAVLAAADLALLTSRNEGTPVALIEAAAAGLPAVATAVGGVGSVVADGVTGVLAPRGDVAALAAAVLALFDDPVRRRTMGQAARARALGRWSEERLLRDVRALYGDLLCGAVDDAGRCDPARQRPPCPPGSPSA